MDRLYIDDNQVIERYVAGKLRPEEADAFEQRLLEDDELLEEVRAVSLLRQGLLSISPSETANPGNCPRRSSDRFAWTGMPLRIAAGLVLAASLAATGVFLFRDGGEVGTDYETMIIELTAVRGGGGEPVDRIALDDDTPRILEFPIPLHGMAGERVVISLTALDRPSGLVDRSELTTAGGDRVVYAILSSDLVPGRYSLEVETESGYLIASYGFRLMKAEN